MAGRRTVTDEQIANWLEQAIALTIEADVPDWAVEHVFNAMLNAAQLPDTSYSPNEALDAVQDALRILNTLDLPLSLRGKAFHFALSGTSQREQVLILKDVPGLSQAH